MINLLSIEDSEGTRVVLKLLIERTTNDMRIEFAEGYKEGMRTLAEKKYDVILLDLIMEGAPVAEKFVAQVVDVSHMTPVIVLSGVVHDREKIATKCLLAGAVEFFSKEHINVAALKESDNELLTRVIRKVYYANQGRENATRRNN